MSAQKSSPGRPRSIPTWAETALAKRLKEQVGFNGYQEIVEWLEQNLGVSTCYKTVHKLVYYRLESFPKVPRTKSVEQTDPRSKIASNRGSQVIRVWGLRRNLSLHEVSVCVLFWRILGRGIPDTRRGARLDQIDRPRCFLLGSPETGLGRQLLGG